MNRLKITVVATDMTIDEYYAFQELSTKQDFRGILRLLQRFVKEDISNPILGDVFYISRTVIEACMQCMKDDNYNRKEFGDDES